MNWIRFGNAFTATGDDGTAYVITWYNNAWASYYFRPDMEKPARIGTGFPTPAAAQRAVDEFIAGS